MIGALLVLVLLVAAVGAILARGDGPPDGSDAGSATTTASDLAPSECAPDTKPDEPIIDYQGPFPDCLDPGVTYTAVFDTTEGEIRVELDTDDTPDTVNNFVNLARNGYYDGTTIFRTDTSIDIIQGGSPHTEDPSDPGPGYTIPDEGSGYAYEPGQLVMARTAAPNSASAQFFFVAGPDAPALDAQGNYVVFGQADAAGIDVLESILDLNVDDIASGLGGAPLRTVTIDSVTIDEG